MGCATQCWLDSDDSKLNLNCCAEDFPSSDESDEALQPPFSNSQTSPGTSSTLHEGLVFTPDGRQKWCLVSSTGLVFKEKKTEGNSMEVISIDQLEEVMSKTELDFQVKVKGEDNARPFKVTSKEEKAKWIDSLQAAIGSKSY